MGFPYKFPITLVNKTTVSGGSRGGFGARGGSVSGGGRGGRVTTGGRGSVGRGGRGSTSAGRSR